MDLGAVADELYALPPQEFVAARDAQARELRPDDRGLASAVGTLRRPTPAAWAINLLARDGLVDELDAVGGRLRTAQETADRQAITALSRERRELVRELARRAGDLAAEAGHPLSPAVLDGVAETLQAALADPDAAAAVRSGRLLRGLESVGFEPVDLEGAVAVPEGAAAERAAIAPRTGRGSGPRAVTDPDAELRRARHDAETAIGDARRAVERAENGIRELADRAAELDRRREELETEVADLERDLRDTRRGLAEAERELQRLDRDRGAAERRADGARAALHRAEERRARIG